MGGNGGHTDLEMAINDLVRDMPFQVIQGMVCRVQRSQLSSTVLLVLLFHINKFDMNATRNDAVTKKLV